MLILKCCLSPQNVFSTGDRGEGGRSWPWMFCHPMIRMHLHCHWVPHTLKPKKVNPMPYGDVIFVILLIPAPFSADTKNTPNPDLLTPKTQNSRCVYQNTPIYKILTPGWNFWHLHRMWCMWQISGMALLSLSRLVIQHTSVLNIALFLTRNRMHTWDTQCLKYVSGGDI